MLTGSRIKKRRLALGMSADTLAELVGKNRATIYRYEGDEIENFSLSVIEPLARALATTPAYLMGWTDDPDIFGNESQKQAPIPEHKADPEIDECIRLFYALSEANRKRIIDLMKALADTDV